MDMPPFMEASIRAEFGNDFSLTETYEGDWLFSTLEYTHLNGDPYVIFISKNGLRGGPDSDYTRICDYGDTLRRLSFPIKDTHHILPPKLNNLFAKSGIPVSCEKDNIYVDVAPGGRTRTLRLYADLIKDIMVAYQS